MKIEDLSGLDVFEARLRHSEILQALLAPGAKEQLGAQAYREMTELLPALVARIAEAEGQAETAPPTPAELEALHRQLGNTAFAARIASARSDYKEEQDVEQKGLLAWEKAVDRQAAAARARTGLASQDDLEALRRAGEALPEGPARTAVMARVHDGYRDLQEHERQADGDA
jgi:hypothetical protein